MKRLGINLVKHKFHDDMYSGFAESLSIKNVLSPNEQFTQVVFSKSENFLNRLKCAIFSKTSNYKITLVLSLIFFAIVFALGFVVLRILAKVSKKNEDS
ncbi:MAG: hypothetical protein IKL10_08460 [Clostridia bacterium]|nr:hypothetical protein [Clostridia bacterium]